MTEWSSILGALGGVVVFLGGVWAIVRGIVRQTVATQDNTKAIRALTGKVDKLGETVNDHASRLGRLEGRRQRREPGGG